MAIIVTRHACCAAQGFETQGAFADDAQESTAISGSSFQYRSLRAMVDGIILQHPLR
ncbi:hypothetical protein [Mesorhizobium captivum]|uniref:hypothetical protein n=1 Tax=Mesorhizobium captivum TaxID=3072319 RepID=UPI002A23C6E7|nr:hypothetical protein [Mesorhizobium sp. VK3C]MDX8447922.1 hypothetical protein [Mesorhizobium sp. VK3C]